MPKPLEVRYSPRTARAFLLRLLESLDDTLISDFVVGENVSIATVTTPEGERFNFSMHKINAETNKPGKRPLLRKKD